MINKFKQLAKKLKKIRANQPRVTLEDAQAQARKIRKQELEYIKKIKKMENSVWSNHYKARDEYLSSDCYSGYANKRKK